MSSAKVTIVAVLASLALSACGTINVKPSANASSGTPTSRGQVDDQRAMNPDHLACLRATGLPVQLVGATDLMVAGLHVHFDPTPGSAQDDQIRNREQSAEVIGDALFYPGNAPDAELSKIEGCLASGVKG
jgi:hypothetical protein